MLLVFHRKKAMEVGILSILFDAKCIKNDDNNQIILFWPPSSQMVNEEAFIVHVICMYTFAIYKRSFNQIFGANENACAFVHASALQ